MNQVDNKRTSVDIPESLHIDVKIKALKEHVTLKEVIHGLLQGWHDGDIILSDDSGRIS